MEYILNPTVLIPLAVFGTFLFGAWALLSFLADRDQVPLDRLKRMSGEGASGAASGEPSLLKSSGGLQEMLEKVAPALSKPFMPKSELEQSQLKLRLAVAGWRTESAVSIYLALKAVLATVGFSLSFVVFGMSGDMTLITWGYVAISLMIGFFLPDLAVSIRAKQRKDAIFYTLPDALDLMVVCVEAGLGLDAAMKRITQEMRKTAPVLTRELEISLVQLQMGRQRREVLHDLGIRNGVDDLRSLVAVLVQADRLGSSIGQALRVQSDSMRTRRKQFAEERAQKCAVKLLIPLILFIFPGIFVILVGPAGIQISKNLDMATGGDAPVAATATP